MTTDEAFKNLVADKALWKKSGLPLETRRRYTYRLAHNVGITEEKKTALLQAAGFVEVPKLWRAPKIVKANPEQQKSTEA